MSKHTVTEPRASAATGEHSCHRRAQATGERNYLGDEGHPIAIVMFLGGAAEPTASVRARDNPHEAEPEHAWARAAGS